jgi:cholest-4-en-3-one 26-monooxygenase
MDVAGVNLLDLDRFQSGEHHEMFRRLRAEAPVSWHDNPSGQGFWNVVTHADVVEVNRDTRRFSSEIRGVNIFDFSGLGESRASFDPRGVMMLYMDPPQHTRYRLLVNKGFTPRMVGLLEQYLRYRSILIVDNIVERGGCDFVEDLAAELPLQAIAEIMGVPQEDRRLLFEWSNRMIGVDDPEHSTEDGTVAAAELYAYVNELAKQRRTDPRDDIVTKLINAEIEGEKLSELEFDMFMMLLTVAGNETTRNTTALGMRALMQHPDSFAEMRDNLDDSKRLDLAIEEILRWASPVQHFARTATEDTVVSGQTIAKGEKVVMWYVSANRDEVVFPYPYNFDIHRTPNDHVAFGGGGAHFCLGANLARMELRLIFREILHRLPDMRPAGEPVMLRSNFISGIKHLPVTYTPGKRVNPAALTSGTVT